MLPTAFSRALNNVLLPGILKLFLISLVIYGVSWLALGIVLGWAITLASGLVGAEGHFMQWMGTLGGWALAWLLFPLLFPILISFFDERMAELIERADYPQLPPAAPPFWPTLAQDVRFSLKAIGLNMLCIPLYFIPGINLVVYYGLNGYLIGAQFFRMSAGRRSSLQETKELLRRGRGSILLAGVGISFCGTIPLLNLAAPLIGVATMLHLYHLMKETPKAAILGPQ